MRLFAAFTILQEDLRHVSTQPVVWAVKIAECEVVLGRILELWGKRGHEAEGGVDIVDVVVELVGCEVC